MPLTNSWQGQRGYSSFVKYHNIETKGAAFQDTLHEGKTIILINPNLSKTHSINVQLPPKTLEWDDEQVT